MQAFAIVDAFEKRVAEFAGSRYGIAVNTGTSAIFLSLQYAKSIGLYQDGHAIWIPAHTFISVPMAAVQCGLVPQFDDCEWSGIYRLLPSPVVDGALRFRRGMYEKGTMHCLSFHARKLLNVGEGGMILTDDENAAKWMRKARYSGRDEATGYRIEDIDMVGWQCYMTPEKAARGLHLMEYIADDLPDQEMVYPDLRLVKAFHERLPVGRELRAA